MILQSSVTLQTKFCHFANLNCFIGYWLCLQDLVVHLSNPLNILWNGSFRKDMVVNQFKHFLAQVHFHILFHSSLDFTFCSLASQAECPLKYFILDVPFMTRSKLRGTFLSQKCQISKFNLNVLLILFLM